MAGEALDASGCVAALQRLAKSAGGGRGARDRELAGLGATISRLAAAGQFPPQAITDTACALAKLQLQDPPLLQALSAAALPRISHFSAHALANLAWAFAKL